MSGAFASCTDQDLTAFLKNGDLTSKLCVDHAIITLNSKYKEVSLTELELKVFEKITSDLEKIGKRLANIGNTPNVNCPYEKDATGENGYFFRRGENRLRHQISIKREQDRFYLLLDVQYDGNFWDQHNPVNITGYSFVGTNGNLEDITAALDNTEKFFPQRMPHAFRIMTDNQRKDYLLKLFRSILGDVSLSGKEDTKSGTYNISTSSELSTELLRLSKQINARFDREEVVKSFSGDNKFGLMFPLDKIVDILKSQASVEQAARTQVTGHFTADVEPEEGYDLCEEEAPITRLQM